MRISTPEELNKAFAALGLSGEQAIRIVIEDVEEVRFRVFYIDRVRLSADGAGNVVCSLIAKEQ